MTVKSRCQDFTIETWEDIAKSYWANRPVHQRWVHDYILYPEIYRIINEGKACSSVLDFGCGDGGLSNYLKKKLNYVDVLMYDESPAMGRLAEENCLDGTLIDNYEDRCYDVICLNMVVQTICEPEFVLVRMRELLTDGGKLIITVSHPIFTLIEARHITTQRHILYKDDYARGIDRYLFEDREKVDWGGGGSNISTIQNHTITAYSNMFSEVGYMIEKISEPLPITEGREEGALFDLYTKLPGFMVFTLS